MGCDDRRTEPRDNHLPLFPLPPPLRARAGVGGDFRGREQSQFPQHTRDDAFQVFADFPVPRAEHPVAAAFQPVRSLRIIAHICRLSVLHAIDFENEAMFETNEIHDIRSDRVLPSEPQPGDAPLAKLRPENALFLGRLRAQTPRDLFRHNGSPTA